MTWAIGTGTVLIINFDITDCNWIEPVLLAMSDHTHQATHSFQLLTLCYCNTFGIFIVPVAKEKESFVIHNRKVRVQVQVWNGPISDHMNTGAHVLKSSLSPLLRWIESLDINYYQ